MLYSGNARVKGIVRKGVEESEEITWGIILKETNELIGTCCLGDFDDGARRSEIGYAITQFYSRRNRKRKRFDKGKTRGRNDDGNSHN